MITQTANTALMGPTGGGAAIPGFRVMVPADLPTGISVTNMSLANGSVIIGDGSGIAQARSISGDITITNTGVVAIGAGVIVDADINASAGIAATKIANGSVTDTEFQYLDGVTGLIQTQFSGKITKGGDSGATLTVGTLTAHDLQITINNNVRWTFDNVAGYFRRGSGSPYFGLQLYGTGVGSVIAIGDVFDSTNPYVMMRENGGTDTDQIELYGQKGWFARVNSLATLSPLNINQSGSVCIGTETPVALTKLTIVGAVHTTGAITIVGNTTQTGNINLTGADIITGYTKYKDTTTPVSVINGVEVNVYYKSNKIIFHYNDGGTVRYKYLDLTGTGVTWVHTTIAP